MPQRNNYFTDREDILAHLRTAFGANKAAALTQPEVSLQAISGLGGIGKTQIAAEYAYRCSINYQAILWVNASSREALVAGFVAIAFALNLAEKNDDNQSRVVAAVKAWLQNNTGWLLIFDNADDLTLIRDFFPSGDMGHILLTTRTQATRAMAQPIEVNPMVAEDGAFFLLRRAGILVSGAPLKAATDTNRDKAREISEAMDGLPLALEQAGAYIERTDCTVSDYLNYYQTRPASFLGDGSPLSDHPESVMTTFTLSFEKVEQAKRFAAELLRLCVFLVPDAIPEEIFTEGALLLQPGADQSEWRTAIGELRKFSLMRYDPGTATLSIHRLVQEVLKDKMDQATRRQWAERAVLAVNRSFPDVEVETWKRCQRCLLHAQACAELIKEWNMEFLEAGRLLTQAGWYLKERAQYAQAESLLKQGLAIREKALEPEHPDVDKSLDMAKSLNELGRLYTILGKFSEAEPLLTRGLAIRERTLGPGDPVVALSLNNLAILYTNQRKYEQAESLYMRTLAIRERSLELKDRDRYVAQTLNNLAVLYQEQRKHEQAEPLYQQAIAVGEKALGPEYHELATWLNNLAVLYQEQRKCEQAEPLYQRAIKIREKALGPSHPDVARTLESYAKLLRQTKRQNEAAEQEARAKAIRAEATKSAK